VDGERNYVAPAPKSAAIFGGIAGFVAGDTFEPVDPSASTQGHTPSSFTGKSRDVFELQDMYRRALAASWASQPGELPADQCIEDIFGGGEGFSAPPKSSHGHGHGHGHGRGHSRHHTLLTRHGRGGDLRPDDSIHSPKTRRSYRQDGGGNTSVSDDERNSDGMGTLRPRDLARLRRQISHQSVASDRSGATVLPSEQDLNRDSSRGIGLSIDGALREPFPAFPSHRREESKITHDGGGLRSRSSSLVSLATATTLGSDRDRGREGFKRAREVDEFEVRDDLVAWTIPGSRM
jgi:hypothetical protein